MTKTEIMTLARVGAAAEVQQLEKRVQTLRRLFPDIGGGRTRGQAKAEEPRQRAWTAAQREAARKRMRAYWRQRREDEK